MRERRRDLAVLFDSGPRGVGVQTAVISHTPVKIFTPPHRLPRAVVVYVHGGGWVTGDTDTHDGVCRHLANEGGCEVVSVDYRRPPEHPSPAAVEDVAAVLISLLQTSDVAGVSVAGDSSGAHVAFEAIHQLPAHYRKLVRAALLIQPACEPAMSSLGWTELGEGYFLSARAMRWFWDQYLAGAEALPLWELPLLHSPPTFILTTSLDPSEAEAHRLATALLARGVETKELRIEGLPHGCFTMPAAFPSAMPALAAAARWLADRSQPLSTNQEAQQL